MIQREVTDKENKTWSCVQAMSFTNKVDQDSITQKLQNEKGEIPVICTPTGGEQTVRLMLPMDWSNNLSDEELILRIQNS